jgi:transcriptional regulator with XRE-family HTH domain
MSKQTVNMPPSETDARLAAVLRRLRTERDLSQERLAAAAGITAGTINSIERGSRGPTWVTVCKLAEALGITLRELGRLVEAEGK